jgi:hypothetical protein
MPEGDEMTSASDLTAEHYQRPDVRESIIDLCKFGGGLRGLNGGDGWYVHQDGRMRLRGPGDFDDTISKERSLYMTADVFDPAVFERWEPKIEGPGGEIKPENPIGTRGDLIAYSLFADIDAVKDPDDEGDEDGKPRSKLYQKGRIEALEAAASFMVRYLRDRGIFESVGILFSGQGVYVWLHPALCDVSENRALPDFDREKQDRDFKIWLMAFNDLLADIEAAFFEEFPEHVGRVKFDKLNNQKRKIKCLLSIHRNLPFAVVPLDKDDIRINLEAARVPLSSETVGRARSWLSTWKSSEDERHALAVLLADYRKKATEDVTARAKSTGDIRRATEPIPVERWCPFYRALLEFQRGAGSHRVCGALATWLFQAGWTEEEGFELWYPVAVRCGVETRIFFTSYGVINSPNCETIKKLGAGYPVLRFGELSLCEPDEGCEGCTWPGDYETPADGVRSISEEELNGLNLATRPKLHNGLEDDHFISQFMDYGAATSDAYPEYYYSGALTLLSVATSRRLVIRIKQGRIYPNIWCFNLGPSTISRKTTVMSQMEDILKAVCPDIAIPKSFSPEALIEFLSECPVSYLVKDEVGQLLANMRKPYMEEVRDFFSEIYDNRDFRRKLRTGKRKDKTDFQITDPYIVQSYATTNTLFREYTTTLDLTSGWLMRFLYFAPNYRKPSMAFDLETGVEAELYGRSLGRFSALCRLFSELGEAPMDIEPEAMEFFQAWQLSTEGALMEDNDEVALALFGRLQVYALKLAVLFTVGRRGYKVGDKIPLHYMQEAVRQVDEYFLPVGRAVVLEVGRSELTNLQNRIIGTLERRGGKVTRRDLLRDLHVRLKDVTEALEALTESGEIESRKEERTGKKPVIWYILLDSRNRHNSPNSPNRRNSHRDLGPKGSIRRTTAPNVTTATIETEETKGEDVAGDVGDSDPTEPEDYQTIAEGLEEAERREAAKAAKFKTPEPKPSDQKPKDDERIFGLTPSYYLDLGGGHLPTVRALMNDLGWDATKADLALGMLKAAGVV